MQSPIELPTGELVVDLHVAADRLGLSYGATRMRALRGRIPSVTFLGRRLVPVEWLDEQTETAA